MAIDKSKLIERFVAEAREHLKTIDEGIAQLEKNPGDSETLDAVFRAAHTIKGSSKMLSIQGINAVSHQLEDALDCLREKKVEHSNELSDLFFKAVDMLSEMVEQTAINKDFTGDMEGLCKELNDVANGKLKKTTEPTQETSYLSSLTEEELAEDLAEFFEELGENIDKMEKGIAQLEKSPEDMEIINNIFRELHTIKGNAAIFEFNDISKLAHSLEDLMQKVRSGLLKINTHFVDHLFEGLGFLAKLKENVAENKNEEIDVSTIIAKTEEYLDGPKQGDVASDNLTKKTEPKKETSYLRSLTEEELAEDLAEFFEELGDNIDKLEKGIAQLEKSPEDMEIINNIFRELHTIKGNAAIFEFQDISKLAHSLEDLMQKVRSGLLKINTHFVDHLFEGLGYLAKLKENVAENKNEQIDVSAIIAKTEEYLDGPKQGKEINKEPEKPRKTTPPKIPPKQGTAKKTKAKSHESIRIKSSKLDETIKLMEEVISHQSRLKYQLLHLRDIENLARKNVELLNRCNDEGAFSSLNGEARKIVDTAHSLHLKLEKFSSSSRDDVTLQELLTEELREKALKLRTLPLSTVFDTFHRAVRDMARSMGKTINLIVEGGETELDKKMIEKIADPLLHMIRNSIDHGIENPEHRRKAGKPEIGTLKISACYEGGNVLLELSDDGGGIPLDKVKEKALQRNLFTEEKLDQMAKPEIINIIFHPGFSTNSIITDVSGRGVGMDIVRENIVDQLKGSIQVETEETRGTSFFIRLPLTLAIMRSLQVQVMDLVFAIPVNSVTEIVRTGKTELIDVLDRKAIKLRDEMIPLVKLEDVLGITGRKQPVSDELLVIIVCMGNEKLGLIVDSLIDEEDVVVKPLPSHMKDIQWVSGVTISGKNEVINVLHVPMIIHASKEMKALTPAKKTTKEAKNILMVDDSISTREIEKDILESHGYKVNLAVDGLDAFEKAAEFQYDLVVTDIEMPNMDGFSLTEKLRDSDDYKHTPIVIVTSREKDEDKERGIQVGADAYIIKGSFDQSNLLETIQNLIE